MHRLIIGPRLEHSLLYLEYHVVNASCIGLANKYERKSARAHPGTSSRLRKNGFSRFDVVG